MSTPTTSWWKRYVQYQKPQARILLAACMPMLAGIYNFGWRVLAVVAVSALTCWATEFAFTRRDGKPATMAAFVSAMLLALILPPNIPFWQVVVGAVFAMVFGKMVFGGFGKNIFNPAMTGRCFLYICFPAVMTAGWYAPFTEGAGGFRHWTTTQEVRYVEESRGDIDAVTSATVLTATKALAIEARQAKAEGDDAAYEAAVRDYRDVPLGRLFLGNINGSMGETSALLILVALAYLLFRGVVAKPLVFGLVIGAVAGKLFLKAVGVDVMPLGHGLAISFLGGGTLFLMTFMVTEPVSAPTKAPARWVYAGLVGFLGMIIRTMSAFNAGFMFALLLGNMFAPILDIAWTEYAAWRKRAAGAAAPDAAGEGGS